MPIESHLLSLVPLRAERSAGAGRHERPGILGCGWFDSSWDLRCGLEVRETSPADARLFDWLDAFLGVQPSVAHDSNGAAQRAVAVALPSSITAIA